MSWWIGVEIDTGGREPTTLADRNVTYNVGGMFRQALRIAPPGVHIEDRCCCRYDEQGHHETGLAALHGTPCVEAAGVVEAALDRMREDPETYRAMNPANGWGSYDTAMATLEWLRDQCRAYPKGAVYVH